MELKFKICDKAIIECGDGVKIKPFYTWKERSDAYNLIVSQDNAFMREYARVIATAKVCTNIDFEGMTDIEIYDICAELGLLYKFIIEVDGYTEFEDMVKSDESTYKLISEMIPKMEKMLKDMMENGNVDKLKEVLSNANK